MGTTDTVPQRREAPSPGGEASDGVVVAQVLAGRRDFFRLLVERYQGRIFALVFHLLGDREQAQDVTQDAFLEAFRSLANFDQKRSLGPWLCRIAQRAAFAEIRRGRRRRETPDHELLQERAVVDGHSGVILRAHLARQQGIELQGVLSELDPKYRLTLLLRHQQELSLQETAEVLEIPVGTVKSRLHEAYRLLRARLGRSREGR